MLLMWLESMNIASVANECLLHVLVASVANVWPMQTCYRLTASVANVLLTKHATYSQTVWQICCQ